MIKKIVAVSVLIIAFLVITVGIYPGFNRIGKPPAPPPPVQLEKPEVTLELGFGPDDIATVSTAAKTPYEALKLVTDVKGIPVKTKQYDFGILVESIRDVANSKDKAWIYFVNGKSGEVAADKHELKPGDTVEWRYTQVQSSNFF